MRQMMFAAALLALAACTPTNQDKTATTSSSTAANETMSTNPAAGTAATAPAPAAASAQEEKPMSYYQDKVAELHTTQGEIDIRFFPDVAPNHVRNFIDLAEKGFYNGTKFHRVIPGFMVQGGDPNTVSGDPSTWGTGGSPNKVKAEFNSVHHRRGIVSMARTSDPDSASSQFFIMVADAPSLDNQYSVFGEVTKGMSVVDKIVSAPRGPNDRPYNPTTIENVTIRPAKENEKGPTPK